MCVVKEGESVFVVTDFESFPEAALIAETAVAAGANLTMGVMSMRELDGWEPEKTMASAMKEAQVVYGGAKILGPYRRLQSGPGFGCARAFANRHIHGPLGLVSFQGRFQESGAVV
jgi:hypothetical protein